jgi:uncharacterized hydrophobic protein (TIGR00271 family)
MDLVMRRRHDIEHRNKLDTEFFVYITTASCIAAVGLITDSSETIVASMLISPVMNHVNAVTFGALLRDPVLWRQGAKGIVVSTVTATALGMCSGAYFSTTLVLTSHMLSRTVVLYLKWSFLVAFFSAIAAGVSIIADRPSNLIGVAISTSILPPLVNFGLLLPNAFIGRSNSVNMHACVFSLLLAIGNIVIIAITCFATIHLYVRVPSSFAWRTQIAAVRASSSLSEAPVLETIA